MRLNDNLNKAKVVKNDELYTQFDFNALSQKFFESCSKCKDAFEKDILKSTKLDSKNEKNILDVSHYSIILMARMIFLHLLEKKELLNHDLSFIKDKVIGNPEKDIEPTRGLWNNLFLPLFKTLNRPITKREMGKELRDCNFPYLSGGLFVAYSPIEDTFQIFEKITLSDEAIQNFHTMCLYKYRITVQESTNNTSSRGVLDPELLGSIFERFMKDDISAETGSVYTPKDVVLFTVRNTLTRFFKESELGEKTAFDLVHKKQISKNHVEKAEHLLAELKVIDPCCGSGAFVLTMLKELFEIKEAIRLASDKRWNNDDKRRAYEDILTNNLFGLDINPEAIILCHLRLWLPIIDLIESPRDYSNIKPLPNLGLNFRCGNALTNPKADWETLRWKKEDGKKLSALRNNYYRASNDEVNTVLAEFDKISEQDSSKSEYITLSRNFLDIRLSQNNGFDIVIGNPPYLGLKDTKKIDYMERWEEQTGQDISDLYIMVTMESYKILNNSGIIAFVTSNTYFTDCGKKKFRDFLLGNTKMFPADKLQIIELSNKTFKKAVSPAIFILSKCNISDQKSSVISFLHTSEQAKGTNFHIRDLNDDAEKYSRRDGAELNHCFTDIPKSVINIIPGNNLFVPNKERMEFLNTFGEKWFNCYNSIWPLIETSKKAEKNKTQLDKIRGSLKPLDIATYGLVTEGGQGLATASNPIHLAVLKGTPEGLRVEEKIRKALENIEKNNSAGKKITEGKRDIAKVVLTLREHGHPYASADFGFVHKIIPHNQVLDISKLSKDEITQVRESGISKNLAKKYNLLCPTYVPCFKGQDADYNRWHSIVDEYIDWSEENVSWFIAQSGKGFSGCPKPQNLHNNFRTGFAWNLIRTYTIQTRLIPDTGIINLGCVYLTSAMDTLSNEFLVAYLNHPVSSNILEVLTLTANTSINDVRALPIVIPDSDCEKTVAAKVKKICALIASNGIQKENKLEQVKKYEKEINEIIYGLIYQASMKHSPERPSPKDGLVPGSLQLIGLITEGGQGLATGCNAIHLAVLEESPKGIHIVEKITAAKEAIKKGTKAGVKYSEGKDDIKEKIKILRQNNHTYASAEFDFVHKIITKDQILDTSKLTMEELDTVRNNGVTKKLANKYNVKYPCYVPYYKGQDGVMNRWSSKIEFFIDWSEENVLWFRNNHSKKFSGSPRWQNSDYYFRRGFTWNLIRTDAVKARMISKYGVNDVGGMMLDSVFPNCKSEYICAWLNHPLFEDILEIVTISVAVQINDIKQMPIIIPDKASHDRVVSLVNQIDSILSLADNLESSEIDTVKKYEKEINEIIYGLIYRASMKHSP